MTSCKICQNTIENKTFITTEMMFGINETFKYLECSKCGCIQLLNIPEDFTKYYPVEYCSFKKREEPNQEKNKIKTYLRNKLIGYHLGNNNFLGKLLSIRYNNPGYFYWIKKNMLMLNSKILDVGCGSGQKLISLRKIGFTQLTGIDPYINNDIYYNCGVRIYRKQIFEITGHYDFIMFHHSFEHLNKPNDILKKAYQLLKPQRFIIIRIPVADSYAYRTYGANWIHLDPPRHLFLHTTKSLELLAQMAGFRIVNVEYDSIYTQFTGSEKNLNNSINFTEKEMEEFKSQAESLNKNKDGDYACFYLYKS